MVNVAVSLRTAAPKDLWLGNLHGEERWERQALEALNLSEKFNVKSYSSFSCNYPVGSVSGGNDAKDTILIVQDFNPSVIKELKWKGVVVNLFSEPWESNLGELKNLKVEYGDNIIFTYGFSHRTLSSESLINERVGSDHTRFLPVPAAPYIHEENNFNKKILLFPYRVILNSLPIQENSFGFFGNALEWAGRILDEYGEYQVYFITGYSNGETSTGELERRVYESVPLLEKNSSRVKFFLGLDWKEVLDIYKETKLMCQVATAFGGPPIEAGMCGIPFVGFKKEAGVLVGCEDYVHASTAEEAVGYLDRLFKDEAFYTKIGNSYREYVRSMHTYEKFADNLYEILEGRGII